MQGAHDAHARAVFRAPCSARLSSRLSLMRKPASLSRVKRPRRCLPRQFPHAGTLQIPCLVGGIDLAAPD